MLFLVLCLVLFPLLYLYWIQNERFKRTSDIPGPKPLPILGNTFEFVFVKSEGEAADWTLTRKDKMQLMMRHNTFKIYSRSCWP